jgi:hypothetical protein
VLAVRRWLKWFYLLSQSGCGHRYREQGHHNQQDDAPH